MIRVGIAGATGYTGIELIRLLSGHPDVVISRLYSKSQVGGAIHHIYPHLAGHLELILEPLSETTLRNIDVLFLALPHGQAQHHYTLLRRSGIKIIDLSADFRLSKDQDYITYYGEPHVHPEVLGHIPLGLPEVYKSKIQQANYVACPGCYATSVMLGLYPLSTRGFLNSTVIADSKSGASGAGRGLKEGSLYCEVNEAFAAYGTGTHRHTAEMEGLLGVPVLFSPHLVPMSRGILSTIYIDSTLSESELTEIYADYANQPFVRVIPGLKSPNTSYVTGTNCCLISFKILPSVKKVVVFSALDNLIKGASGQAIQCMNLMFGCKEDLGLPKVAHYL